jgi:hypothetical protein
MKNKNSKTIFKHPFCLEAKLHSKMDLKTRKNFKSNRLEWAALNFDKVFDSNKTTFSASSK